jgi:hypothetical protein
MATKKTKKNENEISDGYYCEICYYNTFKKTDFNRHLLTAKHTKNEMATKCNIKNEKNEKTNLVDHICSCGKQYKHRSSLFKHKKLCKLIEQEENLNNENIILDHNTIENNNLNNKNNLENLVVQLITENNEIKNTLLRENQELRQQIGELIPKIGNNNTVNNTVNNKFNINVFLNEKCKDAITMTDFVHQIEISLKNLLTTKDKGLGIGLSNIIEENINKLSIYERPIHCTDKKRETLYIKNDKWEKDTDREKTREMFKGLQSQQFKAMQKWIQEHPNYMNDDNLKHEYMILVNKCSASLNDHEKKVMKNLCENTYLADEKVQDE